MQVFPGNLIVKNQRIVFEQHRVNAVGGFLGALIISSSKKPREDQYLIKKSILFRSMQLTALRKVLKQFFLQVRAEQKWN